MPKKSQRRDDVRRANRDRRSRIDELRQQQRSAERRKNLITFGAAILVALILIGVPVGIVVHRTMVKDANNATGKQFAPTAAEKAAGCLGVHNDPVSGAAHHIFTPIDYTTQKYGDKAGGMPPIPPSGGIHNGISLDDKNRFYPLSGSPRPERAVHNLEHGYVVIWYDKELPADQVAKLQLLTSQPQLSRLLVVGWWQSDLPGNTHVVLTSWGRTERCASVSDTVVRNFYDKHLNSNLTPEAGYPVTQGATINASLLPDANGQVPASQTSPSAAPTSTATPTPTPSPSPSKKK